MLLFKRVKSLLVDSVMEMVKLDGFIELETHLIRVSIGIAASRLVGVELVLCEYLRVIVIVDELALVENSGICSYHELGLKPYQQITLNCRLDCSNYYLMHGERHVQVPLLLIDFLDIIEVEVIGDWDKL